MERGRGRRARKGASKASRPSDSFIIDLSPELYAELKREALKRVNPIIRPHITSFLRQLSRLKPQQIANGVEAGETAHTAFKRIKPFSPLKVAYRVARGVLKADKNLREEVNESLTPDLVKLCLRFENPQGWKTLQRYGDRGEEWLTSLIEDGKNLLGVKPKPQKKISQPE